MKRGSHGKNIPVPPEALKITVGFNSTVKRLELQAAPNRERILGKPKKNKKRKSKNEASDVTPVSDLDSKNTEAIPPTSQATATASSSATPFVGYVFVARGDITTSLLTDCFPQLAFSASSSMSKRVKLVELPRGAASRLSKVLHTENASIISLCDDWSEASSLFSLINESVKDVDVPWLEQIFDPSASKYHSLNISFLKTEVPVGKPKKNQKQMNREKKEKKLQNLELTKDAQSSHEASAAGNEGLPDSKKRKGKLHEPQQQKRPRNKQ